MIFIVINPSIQVTRTISATIMTISIMFVTTSKAVIPRTTAPMSM